MITIGITGTIGAGKGTIVDYLSREKGFAHYSVRDFLVGEIKKRKLQVNRNHMVEIANELRKKHSPSFIVEKLYELAIKSGKDCIIESIRTPGEVTALKNKGFFYLFAVDAEAELRYERIVQRNSETDQISFNTFTNNEKREMSSADPNKQNLSKCIEMADYVFINNSTFKVLFEKVETVLKKIIQD
ncbi:AAA family ATPase [Bacteroidota bacterium]